MEKLGLIFDMDGTLWDSSQQVADSWTETLKRKGYPDKKVSLTDMQRVMGKTMTEIADLLFPDLSKEIRYALLEECGREENAYLKKVGGVLYPDLERTLAELKKCYHLYIVSNCQTGYIEAFLSYYGFEKYFEDHLCFGDNGLPKGKNIRLLNDRNHLSKAAYIGDIQGDYNATMEAGLDFIHAAYGFGTIDQPVPRIAQFSDLLHLVPSILE